MRPLSLFAVLCMLVLAVCVAATGDTSAAKSGGAGPYASLAKQMDAKKKSKFLSLLRRMREVKTASLDESSKNATRRAMNSEMQRLLGDAVYQEYRKVRVANTAKAVHGKSKGGGKKKGAAAPAA